MDTSLISNECMNIFLSQAKARSDENQSAFELLMDQKLYGVAIGLLRQELDTLVRLSYLYLPETPLQTAMSLMQMSVDGKQWTKVNHNGKEVKITDRNMLDLSGHLGGWENVIYKFGCKLIHLSDYHLYMTRDPFDSVGVEEKQEIIGYLSFYHKYPDQTITFEALIEYLPKVMEKLNRNVNFYIEEIPMMMCEEIKKQNG
jgi:hypothetical protein